MRTNHVGDEEERFRAGPDGGGNVQAEAIKPTHEKLHPRFRALGASQAGKPLQLEQSEAAPGHAGALEIFNQ